MQDATHKKLRHRGIHQCMRPTQRSARRCLPRTARHSHPRFFFAHLIATSHSMYCILSLTQQQQRSSNSSSKRSPAHAMAKGLRSNSQKRFRTLRRCVRGSGCLHAHAWQPPTSPPASLLQAKCGADRVATSSGAAEAGGAAGGPGGAAAVRGWDGFSGARRGHMLREQGRPV